MDQCSYYSSISLVRQQHESNNIESAQTQETDMIRPANANDEPEIRECAEQAYARYVPVIGRKPAPMLADFRRSDSGRGSVRGDG